MTTTRRPTPADPMPSAWPEGKRPSDIVRSLPPELGPDAVAVLEGISYTYSNGRGDVPAGSIGGLVHEDTRLLNPWELTLNGASLLVLDSGTVDHYSAAFFLTNGNLPGLSANKVGVRRQIVGYRFLVRRCSPPEPSTGRPSALNPACGSRTAAAMWRARSTTTPTITTGTPAREHKDFERDRRLRVDRLSRVGSGPCSLETGRSST